MAELQRLFSPSYVVRIGGPQDVEVTALPWKEPTRADITDVLFRGLTVAWTRRLRLTPEHARVATPTRGRAHDDEVGLFDARAPR